MCTGQCKCEDTVKYISTNLVKKKGGIRCIITKQDIRKLVEMYLHYRERSIAMDDGSYIHLDTSKIYPYLEE